MEYYETLYNFFRRKAEIYETKNGSIIYYSDDDGDNERVVHSVLTAEQQVNKHYKNGWIF